MIIDLKETLGLGLRFDTDKLQMLFNQDIRSTDPGIRTIEQMQDVLLDKQIKEPLELYYMYRDIYRLSDKIALEEQKLRYDVTVIKPTALGVEFMKTAGHYHPEDFGELYEVASGRCFCFLQRPEKENHQVIKEIIIVEAVAGEKIVIPPGFGHILINPGPDYLVTSNWVSSEFHSEYDLYKKAKGAAYFVIRSDQESDKTASLEVKAKYIKNNYFKQIPEINFVKPASKIKKFDLYRNKPMYELITQNPKSLDFLNHPLNYDYEDVFISNG